MVVEHGVIVSIVDGHNQEPEVGRRLVSFFLQLSLGASNGFPAIVLLLLLFCSVVTCRDLMH